MAQQILVLTDFSHDSYNALFYATQLYKNQICTFHMLHAYDKQSHFKEEFKDKHTTKNLEEFLSSRTEECLQETYHKITRDTDKNEKHEFVTVSKNNSFINAVRDYITQNQIDIIVMGTKGRTGAVDIFMGGKTMQVIKSDIDCPVLCIPKQLDFKPISQMGYFTSFRHPLEKLSLSIVKRLAEAFEASLHIVHISDNQNMDAEIEKNKTYLTKYLANACIRFHNLIIETSKSKTITDFVKAKDLDFVIVCYYAHNFFYKIFNEPVVSDLSISSESPLLILNAAEVQFRE